MIKLPCQKLTILAALVGLGLSLNAANVLTNPGFELDAPGQHQNLLGWTWYGQTWGNTFNETGSPARSGNNYFKVFQGFNGAINYNGIYQDNASGPGAVYTADGWAYTPSSDKLAGQNVAWIEVTFRDARANILVLYRSTLVTSNTIASGSFPPNTWNHLSVTNQCDPVTFQVTNTTTTLVAPTGTSYVRYQVVFQGDQLNSGGSLYFDDLALAQVSGAPFGDWNIVWSDEFNGSSVNPSVWTFDTGNGSGGWGNSELQYYTSRPQNVFVNGGLLHIVARQESFGGFNYTSARMKSQGLFSKTYGRFEFRARLPAGLGFWPALWLLGTNINTVGWPACGEIDIMESRGSNLTNVQGSVHSGSSSTAVYTLPDGNVTNFHNYLFEWTTNALVWYVDGIRYQTQTNWPSSIGAYPAPFDRPFFMIMNLAVGGNYLGNPSVSNINANTTFPGEMQVDYVRIYERTSPLRLSITEPGASVLLSWPSNIVCRLQTQTNAAGLAPTGSWVDLPGAPNPFTIPRTNPSAFYRLASP